MRHSALRPEFLLLLQCCQWNFASAVESQARPGVSSGLDWDLFVRLAQRHRVQGLVWNALAQFGLLPSDAAETLSSDARSIAATNLAITGECRALFQAFEEARVPVLFVKGLTVAALAYRSPMLKMGWDIDLLIEPGDLAKAAAILERSGYSVRLPVSVEKLRDWHKRSKESVWGREGFHVELHTRLADNRHLIPGIDVHSPRQRVEVAPSVSLLTLADEELLAYLAIHGASSAWFRLKWISDFGAILAGRSCEDLERLYETSQKLGAARAFGQALLLADRLFGTLQSHAALQRRLTADRATAQLCRIALRILTVDREPTDRRLGTLPIHWTQFLLRPEIGYKLSELQRQVGILRLRH